jgi:PAS domain S-box-containing protein
MIKISEDEPAAAPRAEPDAVLASTHDAVIGSTRLGVINSWNPAATGRSGHAAEEISGRTTQVLVAPDRCAQEAEIFRRIVGGEPAEQYHTTRACTAKSVVAVSYQLLAVARREVVQPRVPSLNGVVTEVEELPRRILGEDLELVAGLPDSLWPILAYLGQIKQVPVNVAINALDAMRGGGTLRIDTANVVVDTDSVARGSPARPGRHMRLAP